MASSTRRVLGREWRSLRNARARIDRRTVADTDTLDRFERLEASATDLMAALGRAAGGDTGAVLTRGAELAGLEAASAREQAAEAVALVRGNATSAARDRAAAARATQQALSGNAPRSERYASDARGVRDLLLFIDQGAGWAVPVEQWLGATDQRLDTVRELGKGLRRPALRASAAARADARDRLVVSAAIVVGLTVTVLVLGLLLARAIRRPIRDVAEAARTTAERRRDPEADLSAGEPETLRVRTRDEVGAVARAVRDLDFAVVDRLRDQGLWGRPDAAPLSVDLARRNRPLLDRQRALIADLAAVELEPARVRTLRDIDALATRMHRNTDSVLVVAGIDEPRAGRGHQPLRDLVRDAVTDVEQFVGVEIVGLPDDIDIADRAADDVEHILAELLGNAARASTDGSPVLVSARRDGSRLEISISDEGVGISYERLDALNEILAHPPLPGFDHSLSLGLVVVARLAERVGARVMLRSAETVGTTATLTLPGEIVRSALAPSTFPPAPVDDWIDDTNEARPEVLPEAPQAAPPEVPPALVAIPIPVALPATEARPAPDSPIVFDPLEPGCAEVWCPADDTLAAPGPPRLDLTLAEATDHALMEADDDARRPVHFTPVPIIDDHDLLPTLGHHVRHRRRRPTRRNGMPTATVATTDGAEVAFARVGQPPR